MHARIVLAAPMALVIMDVVQHTRSVLLSGFSISALSLLRHTVLLCNCQQLRVAILGFVLRTASAYWPLAIKAPLACAKQMPSVADL